MIYLLILPIVLSSFLLINAANKSMDDFDDLLLEVYGFILK